MQVPGHAKAVSLSTSKKGKHLLVNYQDRIIRAFEVMGLDVEGRKQYSLPELRQHVSSITVCSSRWERA